MPTSAQGNALDFVKSNVEPGFYRSTLGFLVLFSSLWDDVGIVPYK